MDCSHTGSFPLICPTCRVTSVVAFWLIVDGESRPDLLTILAQNKLNQTTCPNGHIMEADFPILLFRIPNKPILIFSPSFTGNPDTEPQQAALLVDTLRQKLGDDWQESWRAEMKTIFRPLLPLVARDDPNNLLEKLTTPRSKLFADWPVLKELEDKGDLNDFWAWLLAFVQIDAGDDSSEDEPFDIDEALSEMASEQSDERLQSWADSLEDEDEEVANIVKQHQALLRRFHGGNGKT